MKQLKGRGLWSAGGILELCCHWLGKSGDAVLEGGRCELER